MPTASDFQIELDNMFQTATNSGVPHIDVKAGDLHRRVGDYPDGQKHRTPVCCSTMRKNMKSGDTILSVPPKGNGANLEIQYRIPR